MLARCRRVHIACNYNSKNISETPACAMNNELLRIMQRPKLLSKNGSTNNQIIKKNELCVSHIRMVCRLISLDNLMVR
jgi:hypothetical protein